MNGKSNPYDPVIHEVTRLLDAALALVQSRPDEVHEAGRLLSSPADLAERSAAMANAATQMIQMMSRPIVAATPASSLGFAPENRW